MKDYKERRLDSLFAAARSVRPDTSATEEFFVTRVMVRIREKLELGQPWFSWAWRLAPAFIAVVMLLGVVSIFMDERQSQNIFSAIANDDTKYQVVNYL